MSDTMTLFETEFNAWTAKNAKEIEFVVALLTQKLSDEPEELIRELETIEAWNSRIHFLYAEANTWLDRGRSLYLPGREGNTELDRKIALDSMTSGIQRERDKLEGLCETIKTRLSLGQSILAYLRAVHIPPFKGEMGKIF